VETGKAKKEVLAAAENVKLTDGGQGVGGWEVRNLVPQKGSQTRSSRSCVMTERGLLGG